MDSISLHSVFLVTFTDEGIVSTVNPPNLTLLILLAQNLLDAEL